MAPKRPRSSPCICYLFRMALPDLGRGIAENRRPTRQRIRATDACSRVMHTSFNRADACFVLERDVNGKGRKREESKQETERHTQGSEPSEQHRPTQNTAEAEKIAQGCVSSVMHASYNRADACFASHAYILQQSEHRSNT
jgi:hypothetical protein